MSNYNGVVPTTGKEDLVDLAFYCSERRCQDGNILDSLQNPLEGPHVLADWDRSVHQLLEDWEIQH